MKDGLVTDADRLTRPFQVWLVGDKLHSLKDANGVIVGDESYVTLAAAQAAARRRNGVREKILIGDGLWPNKAGSRRT